MLKPRPSRHLLVLGVFGALVLSLSACGAGYKSESLTLSQPAGLGAVRVHFVICSSNSVSNGVGDCKGGSEETAQSMVVITVPQGWTTPSSFEAPSPDGAPALPFNRNQEVAEEFELKASEASEPVPVGYEDVGYLSAAHEEISGKAQEWEVNIDAAPPLTGSVPYAGPFKTQLSGGWREVNEEGEDLRAGRPLDCQEDIGSGPFGTTVCEIDVAEAETAVTDARVGAATAAAVPVGGKATLTFPLAAASTATDPAPGFALTATTSIPGGSATPVEPTYSPAYDGTTHQGAPATRAVAVTMPPTTPPGTYSVTLTAHAAAGATIGNSGLVVVEQLSLGLGKAKRNLKKGTATVSVSVPAAGILLVSGKNLATVTMSATGPGTLKVTIRAKGKAKKQLLKKGKTRVKPNFVFTPANGAPVTLPQPLLLRRNG